MRRRWTIIAIGAVAVLVVALLASLRDRGLSGDAWAALREAKDFEIVSVVPSPPRTPTPDMLYYWEVRGRAKVTSQDTRQRLLDALEESIRDEPVGAGCFDPRHAVTVTHGGHTFDVLICFSCGYIHWYLDGKEQERVLIGRAGADVFNQVFTDAHLPIAP